VADVKDVGDAVWYLAASSQPIKHEIIRAAGTDGDDELEDECNSPSLHIGSLNTRHLE
jgi:hypothetical protein